MIRKKDDEKFFKDMISFKRKKYGLVGIEINEYLNHTKQRSSFGKGKFNAISVSREKFSKLVRPISHFLF